MLLRTDTTARRSRHGSTGPAARCADGLERPVAGAPGRLKQSSPLDAGHGDSRLSGLGLRKTRRQGAPAPVLGERLFARRIGSAESRKPGRA